MVLSLWDQGGPRTEKRGGLSPGSPASRKAPPHPRFLPHPILGPSCWSRPAFALRELWVALPRGRTEEDVGDDSYTEASARGGVRRGFPQRPAPARLQRPAPPRAPPPGGGAGSAPPRAPPRPAPRHTPQARPTTGHWLRDYQIPRGWGSGDLCLSGLLGPGLKTNSEGFPRHPDFKYPVLSSE